MKIGDKLRIIRNLKGFTQEEVAQKLNMERRSYVNLENNSTKVDLQRMNQIANFYGIELEELLTFDAHKAFDKCFNKNAANTFSIEKIKSETSEDERKFFIQQIQILVNSLNS